MAKAKKRPESQAQKNNRATKNAYFIFVFALLFCLGGSIGTLGYRMVYEYDYYSAKAESNAITDSADTPVRGTIYDSTGKAMSESNNLWLLFCDNSTLFNEQYYTQEKRIKKLDNIAKQLALITASMDNIETLEYIEIFNAINTEKASNYIKLIEQIGPDDMLALKEALSDAGIYGFFNFERDPKRYYNNSSVGSAVLGFLNSDDEGVNGGVEESYNSYLVGQSGRTVSLTDRYNYSLYGYDSEIYSEEKQLNVVLNIDYEVQSTLETILAETCETYGGEGACGIVMDVNTFDIVGMASVPTYDLNNRSELTENEKNGFLKYITDSQLESMSEDEIESALLSLHWANRAINANFEYEPGSVSKILTTAAALEEGVADENTAYPCYGTAAGVQVADITYTCWSDTPHANSSLVDLLKNSCNPFAVQLSQKLGTDRYYDYFEAFGFTEKTGVDLPGEANSVYVDRDDFKNYNLSSYSFGQTFYVTPLQVISMVATVANGGYLMTPHVVDRVEDEYGNVVFENTPEVRRQVISEETSELMCSMLEQVVENGSGVNAKVSGYRIAGKTGTSEDLVALASDGTRQYWASFCGFAPADDPQYALLVVVYKLPSTSAHGGGKVAGTAAGKIFSKILPYLNVPTVYDENQIRMPSCEGCTVAEAQAKFSSSVNVKIVGDGDIVTGQNPVSNTAIDENGVAILYTGSSETEMVVVPDFSGLSISQARSQARSVGLNAKCSGDSTFIVEGQSYTAGTSVPYGTVITLTASTDTGVQDG